MKVFSLIGIDIFVGLIIKVCCTYLWGRDNTTLIIATILSFIGMVGINLFIVILWDKFKK
jgi:hypothetical protein